ncbi:MAG: hypothetical protein Q7J86_04720, partial [Bacteroidota bacterium]|nr:hypothetical protein [Bacteroidota bacterium]
MGGSLKINALTAILSLFIGAAVWGLAGMILFLPFVAMLRVICEEFEELKPVALMMGEQNKNENIARNGVFFQVIPDNSCQSIEPIADVDGAATQKVSQVCTQPEHL